MPVSRRPWTERRRPLYSPVLDAREARWYRRLDLSAGGALLTLTLNVPGPKKDGQPWESLHRKAWAEVLEFMDCHAVARLKEELYLTAAGPEAHLLTSLPGRELKELAVRFEGLTPIGPLLDLDVMEQGRPLSREDLGLPPRKCFCCDQPARLCAAARRHSLEEVMAAALAMARCCEGPG